MESQNLKYENINNEYISSLAEYNAAKDSCIFETCDMLRQIQENAEIESKIEQRRFIIQTVLSVSGLIAAVVAAVAAIIALL